MDINQYINNCVPFCQVTPRDFLVVCAYVLACVFSAISIYKTIRKKPVNFVILLFSAATLGYFIYRIIGFISLMSIFHGEIVVRSEAVYRLYSFFSIYDTIAYVCAILVLIKCCHTNSVPSGVG